MEFIRINDLLDCPVPALDLLLELERQNFCCTPIDDQRSISVWPASQLSNWHTQQGQKYKSHLYCLLKTLDCCTCPRCRDMTGAPITEPERAQLNARLGKKQLRLID
jgi:hypothetical protein